MEAWGVHRPLAHPLLQSRSTTRVYVCTVLFRELTAIVFSLPVSSLFSVVCNSTTASEFQIVRTLNMQSRHGIHIPLALSCFLRNFGRTLYVMWRVMYISAPTKLTIRNVLNAWEWPLSKRKIPTAMLTTASEEKRTLKIKENLCTVDIPGRCINVNVLMKRGVLFTLHYDIVAYKVSW